MTITEIIIWIIIAATILLSYKGFKDPVFFDNNIFNVDKVLVKKEYRRLLSSGFLHADWTHLMFNMLSLYLFSGILTGVGPIAFVFIYFGSMVGGDLLALLVHKNHGDYSAVGASGAVCGIIFACIALAPGMGIGLFLLPFTVPGWLYGILYIAYAMYGVRSKKDNIGHEAHLGGALIGMLIAILFYPEVLLVNYLAILLIVVPTLIFIYLIATKPQFLFIDNYFYNSRKKNYSIDHLYNEKKVNRQKEVDRLLEKIHSKGMNSLSAKEKQILEEYSKSK